MDEIWKPVNGYEGLYEVSNIGRVRSLKRKSTKGRVLKLQSDKDGYKTVNLSRNNISKVLRVHRLVAMAFIENTDSTKNIINHKNEDKGDNRVENLEWCDSLYNTRYNGAVKRRGIKQRVPIIAVKDGVEFYFTGITEAAKKLGVSQGNICGCLKGKYRRKTLKGYSFRYVKISQQAGDNQ